MAFEGESMGLHEDRDPGPAHRCFSFVLGTSLAAGHEIRDLDFQRPTGPVPCSETPNLRAAGYVRRCLRLRFSGGLRIYPNELRHIKEAQNAKNLTQSLPSPAGSL